MWLLGSWRHALLHGLDPFVTHAQFVLDGFNFEWATSLPLASVALAVRRAFGRVCALERAGLSSFRR